MEWPAIISLVMSVLTVFIIPAVGFGLRNFLDKKFLEHSKAMNGEYMPREILNEKFTGIETKLQHIDDKIDLAGRLDRIEQALGGKKQA